MKTYIQPLIETEELALCTMIAASGDPTNFANEMGNGWHSKQRAEEEEEEEAYAASHGCW